MGAALLGLAPLMIVHKGELRILKFIGTGHSDYCDFLYGQNNVKVLAKMVECLMKHKANWDAMALDCIPEGSPTAEALNAVCAEQQLYVRRYSRLPCPAIALSENKDVMGELLKKKSMQRHYNHFQKKGEYRVLHLKTQADIEPYLDEFFTQHIKRRGGEKNKSLFLNEASREFYRNCLRHLGPQQWITFTVIESQGQNIAFHFGLTYGRSFLWYKPSFDPGLAKFSPGEVLLREVLVYAADHGFDEFDFTIGQEAFKSRFANILRHNVSFKVFKSKCDRLADQAFSMAKAMFKQ